MSDNELKQQFDRCLEWKDPDQWDLLGIEYFNRGYLLNADLCFTYADNCRGEK